MPEMERLACGEAIDSTIAFPSHKLTFSVKGEIDRSDIDFRDDLVAIVLPLADLVKVHETDQVGISFTKEWDEVSISVLLEKDFKCLTDRKEDESLLYTNPGLSH